MVCVVIGKHVQEGEGTFGSYVDFLMISRFLCIKKVSFCFIFLMHYLPQLLYVWAFKEP